MYILGISAYYHDSAAALIKGESIIAAAQEERFTRKKGDSSFPINSIKFCLNEARVSYSDIKSIIFYDKPLVKFERLLETYLSFAPKGIASFVNAMPIWLKEKLFLKRTLRSELASIFNTKENNLPELLFSEHHLSHAASAFFPSPFKKSAILCLDGVGEWATSTVWYGDKNKIVPKWEIQFPHSLGLLYSAFTYYCGFKVNSGEYKLMGLAPYGEPKFVQKIYENLVDVKQDGTFRLNMKYFNFATGLTMTNKNFNKLFDGPPRVQESQISQKEMDLAKSIQVVLEEIVMKIVNSIYSELQTENLCLAGGVALNCVLNGKILRESSFKNIWIQPASGDAGGALGAALTAYFHFHEGERKIDGEDKMKGSYLGKSYSNDTVREFLDKNELSYTELDEDKLISEVALILKNENVVGWHSGRMEFGPRALGARSIIGDPRSPKMQKNMNLKIKYRESFRPFAPVILPEHKEEWFDINVNSPYMMLVAPVKDSKRLKNENSENLFGIDKLNEVRSSIPAVTHVDYSARIQTINKNTNPKFYKLLKEFNNLTNCPILINTSFNVRGEPIVCSPEDSYRCFMRTEMDYLVIENFLLKKSDQPKFQEKTNWKEEFALD